MNIYDKNLLRIIQPEMVLVEEELLSVVRSPVKLFNNIGEYLIKAGGKRLRPALYFLCAYDGLSSNTDSLNTKKALSIAVSLELIHMATLIHDDVIDNAASRRGNPTANICWGNRNSVLAGDYFLAKALSCIAPNASPREFGIITNMISILCEGEISQQYNSFNIEQTEEDYETRIFQKTANFIAISCELGAIAAKFTDEHVAAFRQYGCYLGMAFQLTDDILDISASSQELGKPAGHDLGQGVITLPVIRALKTSEHRIKLQQLIAEPDISAEKIEEALEIIRSSDAIEYSYARTKEYLEKAGKSLPNFLSSGIKDTLFDIIDFVEKRRN